MSAMPAWGKTLDDAAIWDLVAFVRKLPTMTPEAYQQVLPSSAK
jgi:mono/diheme cytochrome c family protein